jgi:ribosomal protein L29
MHPLSSNLKELSLNTLFEKLKELNQKLYMTTNPSLINQITMLIEDYKSAIEIKQKQDKELEKELDELIKIS